MTDEIIDLTKQFIRDHHGLLEKLGDEPKPLCECAKLEWDESMYHLEHHPKCLANKPIIYVTEEMLRNYVPRQIFPPEPRKPKPD